MRKTYNRASLIKLIHVAKRDVAGMEDDGTYRAMLRSVTGKDSCTDMRDDQLNDVLLHLKKSGFKVRSKAKPSRPLADDAESKKIRALWLFLHQLGVVKNPSESALASYVKRMTGVDALQWIHGGQSMTVIEALKKWALRFLPAAIKQLIKEASAIPLSTEERVNLNYVVSLAFDRGTFEPMHSAWEQLTDVLKAKVKVEGDRRE